MLGQINSTIATPVPAGSAAIGRVNRQSRAIAVAHEGLRQHAYGFAHRWLGSVLPMTMLPMSPDLGVLGMPCGGVGQPDRQIRIGAAVCTMTVTDLRSPTEGGRMQVKFRVPGTR